MTTQAEHEAAADEPDSYQRLVVLTASMTPSERAFMNVACNVKPGGRLALLGDMSAKVLFAYRAGIAADRAEAVRVARIKGLNEAHAIAYAAALGWEDESGKSRSGERIASRLIAEAILRRARRAEGDATIAKPMQFGDGCIDRHTLTGPCKFRNGGIMPATHRCKVCGAHWRLNAPTKVQPEGSWSLVSKSCGKCCDNVAMGDQIERMEGDATPGPEEGCSRPDCPAGCAPQPPPSDSEER